VRASPGVVGGNSKTGVSGDGVSKKRAEEVWRWRGRGGRSRRVDYWTEEWRVSVSEMRSESGRVAQSVRDVSVIVGVFAALGEKLSPLVPSDAVRRGENRRFGRGNEEEKEE
tara:strand:+ start:136 stop:471 length:336 start_codon:yes stop_codon:yes gene_type:complete